MRALCSDMAHMCHTYVRTQKVLNCFEPMTITTPTAATCNSSKNNHMQTIYTGPIQLELKMQLKSLNFIYYILKSVIMRWTLSSYYPYFCAFLLDEIEDENWNSAELLFA